jgi:hypothetical protein
MILFDEGAWHWSEGTIESTQTGSTLQGQPATAVSRRIVAFGKEATFPEVGGRESGLWRGISGISHRRPQISRRVSAGRVFNILNLRGQPLRDRFFRGDRFEPAPMWSASFGAISAAAPARGHGQGRDRQTLHQQAHAATRRLIERQIVIDPAALADPTKPLSDMLQPKQAS